MQRCKSCGSESPDQARFCGSCGHSLNATGARAVTARSADLLPTSGKVTTDVSPVGISPLPTPSLQDTSTQWTRAEETQTSRRSNPSASKDREQEEGLGAVLVDTSVPLIPATGMPIVPSTPPISGVPMVQGTPSSGDAPMIQGTPLASNPPTTTPTAMPQHPQPSLAQPQHLQSPVAQPQHLQQTPAQSWHAQLPPTQPQHSQLPPAQPQHSQLPSAQPQQTQALFCGYCGRPLNNAATRMITNVGTRIDKTKTQRGSGQPTKEGNAQEDEYNVVMVDTAVPPIPAKSVPMVPSTPPISGVPTVQGTPLASNPSTTPSPALLQHTQLPLAQPQHLQLPPAQPQHTQLPSAQPQYSQPPQASMPGAPTASAPLSTGVFIVQGSGSSPHEKNSKGKGKSTLSPIQIGIIIVILLIMGSIVVYGLVHNFHVLFPFGNFTLSNASSSSQQPTPTIGPASSAIVSIVPMRMMQQGTYTITAITGNPNGAKQQVFAHIVTATTTPVSKTVNATGQGTTQGTHAKGMLRVRNPYSGTPQGVDMTYNVGTIFDDDPGNSPNVQMMFEATIIVPGDGTSVTVPAEVVQSGTIGNISQIRGWTHYGAYGDPAPLDIDNSTPFTSGTDPQPYSSVRQSDIDNATNQLISANTPSARLVVQGLVKPSERFIGTPHCNPSNPSANHSAGDRVSQVTVTISFTCSGEVYDYEGALRLAQTLLKQHVQQLYPNTLFVLVGTITTTMRQQPTLATSSGTVTMKIDVSGTWRAQFDTKGEQAIAQAIAGKTIAQAQALLKAQAGIKTSSIDLQGGNSDILPTNPDQITFVIQST